MNRTEKKEVISKLHEKMAKAKAAILAEPRGLDVATVTELRRKFRDAQVDYKVVKNTLAQLAAKGTPVEPLIEKFVGPTALVMSYGDVVAPAKILADFAKDRENFTIRSGVIEPNHRDIWEQELHERHSEEAFRGRDCGARARGRRRRRVRR